MHVVGIDISLTSTGMCSIRDGNVSVWTVPSRPLGTTLDARAERLDQISKKIAAGCLVDDLRRWNLDLVVIEAPSLGQSRQGGTHDRSGLWWLVVDCLRRMGATVVEVPPACRAKYAAGKGNATKDAVMLAVARRYDGLCLVSGNDEADALVLAAMGARHLGRPVEVSPLPAANVAGMDGVAWPVTA